MVESYTDLIRELIFRHRATLQTSTKRAEHQAAECERNEARWRRRAHRAEMGAVCGVAVGLCGCLIYVAADWYLRRQDGLGVDLREFPGAVPPAAPQNAVLSPGVHGSVVRQIVHHPMDGGEAPVRREIADVPELFF